MQTHLAAFIRDTTAGREAEAILRACVHCGFCTATCPTYQLLGDELDGPRGRIYLIKEALQGAAVTAKTQLHLDRCLSCRSCETTCPSGVQYGRLLDIGRAVVARRVRRSLLSRLARGALKTLLATPWLFAPAYRLGQWLRPLLPARLRAVVLPYRAPGGMPLAGGQRLMIVLGGCVQPAMAPNINAASARVLAALGIELRAAPDAGCCGAIPLHLEDVAGALTAARRNIDAWWPLLEAGAEAIVITASGCGTQVRDYAHLLHEDPRYATKAARVSLLTRDIAEVIAAEKSGLLSLLAKMPASGVPRRKLAFHAPCSLSHGLKVRGVAEELLRAAGFELTAVTDGHLCCGSAGSYSLLQPKIARRLRSNKLAALSAGAPAGIATANIGCLAYLQGGTSTQVHHWVEYLDEELRKGP